jgi:ferredoxin-thioredoxin reductase catalytic subunit
MGNKWDSVVGTTEYNENLMRISRIAQEHSYVLNPDQKRLRKVIGIMTMNKTEFGKYYCPCKQNHPLDLQKDVLCPCPELADEVTKDNHCFCRLFYKRTQEKTHE